MKRIVLLVTRNGLGTVPPGHEDFGVDMLDRLLHTWEGREVRPAAICFYTEGVRVVCQGSAVVEGLKLLEGLGVRLVACGTCLTRFGLDDALAVGEKGTMLDIVNLMIEADQVITV